MFRRYYETISSTGLRSLLVVSLIGGAAVGGSLSEAAHGDIPGALVYLGIGSAAIAGVGIVLHKNNHPN